MKTYDNSRDEDNHLELKGFCHMLTIDKSGGNMWLALLSVWPDGRYGRDGASALITPDDARAMIKFLTKLLDENDDRVT